MIRAESESIFLAAVLDNKSKAIRMTDQDTKSFRVHVHRIMKDMEKSNHSMWLKAKQFGIAREGDTTFVRKASLRKWEMFTVEDDGTVTPFDMSVYDDLTEVIVEVAAEPAVAVSNTMNCRSCAVKTCVIRQSWIQWKS
jgi:hypothetical protein